MDGDLLERSTVDILGGDWGNVHAFLVARNGFLVHEAYFSGQDEIWGEDYQLVDFGPTVRHGLRSVSKSFTSTLIGIAIEQGLIESVDVGLGVLLPDYSSVLTAEKADITLRHVLTMSAGLSWAEGTSVANDADDDQYDLAESDDPVSVVLARDPEAAPGTEFNYSGGLTQVLASVVEHAAQRPLLQYADSFLFSPLGIEDWEWFSLGNAHPAAWTGLRLTARDMAKLGQVYLDGGQWQGRSIVSEEWVQAALQPHISVSEGGAPSHVLTSGYGFQWWYDLHEWEPTDVGFYSAMGNGGQRIIIIPTLNLVVAVFAGFYEDSSNAWTPEALVREYVLPAVTGPA